MGVSKYMRVFLIISLLLICINAQEKKEKNPKKKLYKNLLKWGRENGLFLSDKLGMNYTDENTRNYYLKEDVQVNETLMEIPVELTLSSVKAYELLKKSKKVKQLHKKIKPDKVTIKLNDQGNSDFRQEETFIASVLYLVNHYPEKYEKSKFVEYFKAYMDNLDSYVDYFPYFYTKEQRAIFQTTSFGGVFDLAEKSYNEDSQYLIDIVGLDVDMEEFSRYRSLVTLKGLKVKDHFHMIPFIDMMYKNPVNYNLNLTYDDDKQTLKIFATKEILKEEDLVFISPYMPNLDSFYMYGTTYPEMVKQVKQFGIPVTLPAFLDEKKIDKEKADLNARVDLTDEKFYEKIMTPLKNLLKKTGKEADELNALQLFLENLQFLRKGYNAINPSVIYRNFVGKKNIENAIRLMETEKFFVDDRIRIMYQVIDIFKDEIKKKKASGEFKDDKDEPDEPEPDL